MASLFAVFPTDGSPTGAGATTGQFRAFWADAFGEGINDQSEIDALVATTKAAHANAIVAQVVRRGDCFCLRSGLPVNESIAPDSIRCRLSSTRRTDRASKSTRG